MSSTTPGWYPDPDPSASAGRQRWFDGTGWTEHVSAPAVAPPAEQFAPVYAAAPVQVPAYGSAAPTTMPYAPTVSSWGGGPALGGHIVVGSMSKAEARALPRKERNSKDRPDLDLARGRNQLTYNAVLYGAVSLLINPFLVFSIMAIVWSVRGRKRAEDFQRQGYPPLGRGQADAGLTLGIVGTVVGVALLVLRFASALSSM
ncbi:DUF2510 domain-containing protein [Cellulomonas sp. P5_C5]